MSQFFRTPQGKFLGGIAIIIIALFGYYFASDGSKSAPVDVPVVSVEDHLRGAKDAPLTLVEFGDFQCPACGAYESIVRQVLADNTGKVKIVFKHFPLTSIHRNALLSAKASEAASLQGKFWEMHDMLYDKQSEWGESLMARDLILNYATTLRLDLTKFKADLENKAIEEKILAQLREGTRLGVQGTPTFYLNGVKLDPSDTAGVETFNKTIKSALAKPIE